MPRLLILAAFMALLVFATSGLRAEVVHMPAPEKQTFSVELPGRGMSMVNVEARFGQPLERSSEVGQPPITRWVYKDFTVYFEYQYVIHAVLNNP